MHVHVCVKYGKICPCKFIALLSMKATSKLLFELMYTLNELTIATYLEVVVPSISLGLDFPSVSIPTLRS